MDCCKPDYDSVFSQKRAKKDLKRYRKKGPDKTTRLLIDALKAAGVHHRTVLDIGGGIGAIDHELLAAGAESAVHVEAAEAFAGAAAEEAERRGHERRMQFRRGDFVDLAPDIREADVVTLDRVICCYADMEPLVTASTARARRLYGVVVPRERVLTKLMQGGINTVFRMSRNPFRFHVHPFREIERLVTRAGLRLRWATETIVWRVAVFER